MVDLSNQMGRSLSKYIIWQETFKTFSSNNGKKTYLIINYNIKVKYISDGLTFLSGKLKIPEYSGNTIKKLLLCFKWKTL